MGQWQQEVLKCYCNKNRTSVTSNFYSRGNMHHHHQKYSLSPKIDMSSSIRSRSGFGSRSPSPIPPASVNTSFHGNPSSAHTSNGLLLGTGNGHTASPNSSTSAGGSWTAASSTIESSANNGLEKSQNSCCYHHNNQQRQCPHSGVLSSSAMINGSNYSPQTIEDQIRAVDKVIKVGFVFIIICRLLS